MSESEQKRQQQQQRSTQQKTSGSSNNNNNQKQRKKALNLIKNEVLKKRGIDTLRYARIEKENTATAQTLETKEIAMKSKEKKCM